MKNFGIAENELSRLEAFPPANRASPLERDGNNIKWKGLTILKHTGKIPRIVKGDVVQGCSSRKAKLVELNDEETPVEKSCEVVDLECDNCERETCETQMFASSTCFNTMGLVKKRKVPESQGSAASSVLTAKGSGSGDYKEASASAFLSQVRSHPLFSCFSCVYQVVCFHWKSCADNLTRPKKSSTQKNIRSLLDTCKH